MAMQTSEVQTGLQFISSAYNHYRDDHKLQTKRNPIPCPYPNCNKRFSSTGGAAAHARRHRKINQKVKYVHPGCGKMVVDIKRHHGVHQRQPSEPIQCKLQDAVKLIRISLRFVCMKNRYAEKILYMPIPWMPQGVS